MRVPVLRAFAALLVLYGCDPSPSHDLDSSASAAVDPLPPLPSGRAYIWTTEERVAGDVVGGGGAEEMCQRSAADGAIPGRPIPLLNRGPAVSTLAHLHGFDGPLYAVFAEAAREALPTLDHKAEEAFWRGQLTYDGRNALVEDRARRGHAVDQRGRTLADALSWTGASTKGWAGFGEDCDAWTSAAAGRSGQQGDPGVAGAAAASGSADCSTPARVQCVSVPTGMGPSPPPPFLGDSCCVVPGMPPELHLELPSGATPAPGFSTPWWSPRGTCKAARSLEVAMLASSADDWRAPDSEAHPWYSSAGQDPNATPTDFQMLTPWKAPKDDTGANAFNGSFYTGILALPASDPRCHRPPECCATWVIGGRLEAFEITPDHPLALGRTTQWDCREVASFQDFPAWYMPADPLGSAPMNLPPEDAVSYALHEVLSFHEELFVERQLTLRPIGDPICLEGPRPEWTNVILEGRLNRDLGEAVRVPTGDHDMPDGLPPLGWVDPAIEHARQALPQVLNPDLDTDGLGALGHVEGFEEGRAAFFADPGAAGPGLDPALETFIANAVSEAGMPADVEATAREGLREFLFTMRRTYGPTLHGWTYFTDGAQAMLDSLVHLTSAERQAIHAELNRLHTAFLTGTITAEELGQAYLTDVHQVFNPVTPPFERTDRSRRLSIQGMIETSLAAAISENVVMPRVYELLAAGSVAPLSSEDAAVLAQLGVTNPLRLIHEFAASLQPAYDKLTAGGGRFDASTRTWDLASVALDPGTVAADPELALALAALVSPDFARSVVDRRRQHFVTHGDQVWLPPDRDSGAVELVSVSEYESRVRSQLNLLNARIDDFADAVSQLSDATEYIDIRLGDWVTFDPFSAGTAQSRANQAWTGMNSVLLELRALGAPRTLQADVASIAHEAAKGETAAVANAAALIDWGIEAASWTLAAAVFSGGLAVVSTLPVLFGVTVAAGAAKGAMVSGGLLAYGALQSTVRAAGHATVDWMYDDDPYADSWVTGFGEGLMEQAPSQVMTAKLAIAAGTMVAIAPATAYSIELFDQCEDVWDACDAGARATEMWWGIMSKRAAGEEVTAEEEQAFLHQMVDTSVAVGAALPGSGKGTSGADLAVEAIETASPSMDPARSADLEGAAVKTELGAPDLADEGWTFLGHEYESAVQGSPPTATASPVGMPSPSFGGGADIEYIGDLPGTLAPDIEAALRAVNSGGGIDNCTYCVRGAADVLGAGASGALPMVTVPTMKEGLSVFAYNAIWTRLFGKTANALTKPNPQLELGPGNLVTTLERFYPVGTMFVLRITRPGAGGHVVLGFNARRADGSTQFVIIDAQRGQVYDAESYALSEGAAAAGNGRSPPLYSVLVLTETVEMEVWDQGLTVELEDVQAFDHAVANDPAKVPQAERPATYPWSWTLPEKLEWLKARYPNFNPLPEPPDRPSGCMSSRRGSVSSPGPRPVDTSAAVGRALNTPEAPTTPDASTSATVRDELLDVLAARCGASGATCASSRLVAGTMDVAALASVRGQLSAEQRRSIDRSWMEVARPGADRDAVGARVVANPALQHLPGLLARATDELLLSATNPGVEAIVVGGPHAAAARVDGLTFLVDDLGAADAVSDWLLDYAAAHPGHLQDRTHGLFEARGPGVSVAEEPHRTGFFLGRLAGVLDVDRLRPIARQARVDGVWLRAHLLAAAADDAWDEEAREIDPIVLEARARELFDAALLDVDRPSRNVPLP